MKKYKLLIKINLIICLLFVLSKSTSAQQELSLNDALAITIKKNIDIKIKTHELQQIKNYENVGFLGVLPRLKINSSVSGNEGVSNIKFATDQFPGIEDADSESKSINSNIEFSYNIFNGLASIYTYQKIKTQSNLKSTELSIEIEQTLLKTAKQFFDIAYLQEKNKIINELLSVSKERYGRIKVQNEFGNASLLSLLSAEIDLNKDSVYLMNSEFELEVAKSKLNQTLNNTLDSKFYVENKIDINKNLQYSILKEETMRNNNNILFQQYIVEISKKDKKANSSYSLPRIDLSLQYGYNNIESNTSLILDQTTLGLTAFVNLSWDIFDAIAKQKVVQNTKIEIESNKLALMSVRNGIEREFNTTFQQYLNNINLIEIEKRNNITAQKFFEKAKEEFYQGQLNRNDFRLAQIDVSMSKNRLNQALYNAKIAELNLYRLSGKIIDDVSN